MKLYSKTGFDKNNLKHYNKKIRQYNLLISDEGIFKLVGKILLKMIIKKDSVKNIKFKNEELILYNSDFYFIEYNKIPFNYSNQEYCEEIFIINDEINIVCLNDKIWYAEYSNENNTQTVLNIITNIV